MTTNNKGADSSSNGNAVNPFVSATTSINNYPVNQANTLSSYGQMPVTRRRRRRWPIVLAIMVALSAAVTGIALGVVRYSLVIGCNRASVAYRLQAQRLRQLVNENREVAKITIDDVASDNQGLVKQFQSDYRQARHLLNGVTNDTCSDSDSNDQLKQIATQLEQSTDKMDSLYDSISGQSDKVDQAHQDKLLADAKVALKSTILSAQNLSNNRSLSASTRTQLNRVVVQAQSILASDDLDDIVSARKQMDSIIEKVNNALSAASSELLDIEQKVAALTNQADDNGSYIGMAIKIINTAGLKESWGFASMGNACAITSEQAAAWIAAFCSGTPQMVYINDKLPQSTTNDVYFADAMRHEVAHYLIYRRCGTSDPASIGTLANAESTASSYAVLYLGANANTLNRASDSRYSMNQASDEAAARIHAGQCY